MRTLSVGTEDWAGVPMPLDGESLVVEPSYRFAKIFNAPEIEANEDLPKIRNTFWSTHRRCKITVYENKDGGIDWFLIPGIHHFTYDLQTLGCSVVWGVEQESNALQLLATMVPHHTFKMYLLTGMFLESSPRSGITYAFRKLKPTVAMTARNGDMMSILCALCMHPIAYYQGSWAGAMCPTDDVIAHLSLMRGDEAMFWRRANQHAPHLPEAGL